MITVSRALTGGITTSFISLLISDFAGRVTTVVIGVALIVFGTFLAWREFVRSQHESKADVKVMKSAEELYKYVKMRIEQARERVDDLTWGPLTMELTTFADKQAFDDYVETIGAICRKGTIAYREVMSFPLSSTLMFASNEQKGCSNRTYLDIISDITNSLPTRCRHCYLF
jgi:hypothetical protein